MAKKRHKTSYIIHRKPCRIFTKTHQWKERKMLFTLITIRTCLQKNRTQIKIFCPTAEYNNNNGCMIKWR